MMLQNYNFHSYCSVALMSISQLLKQLSTFTIQRIHRLSRGWSRLLRGLNRVLLITWVGTGYCGVHGRMPPPLCRQDVLNSDRPDILGIKRFSFVSNVVKKLINLFMKRRLIILRNTIDNLGLKNDTDAWQAYLSNSVGQDMADKVGRKQRAKDAKQGVKLVVETIIIHFFF